MRRYKKLGALILTIILALSLAATAFAWEYTVESGDTLWDIAAEQLGSGYKWTEIYEANKDTIKNPDLIYVGQVIEIPDGQPAPQVPAEVPAQAPAGTPAQPAKPADALPGIAGTYSFTESAMGGAFTVDWTLVLNEDGTFTLTESNAMLGDTTYTGETYTAEGLALTTGPLSGGQPQAAFFNDDLSCVWTLDPIGKTVTPVNYDAGTSGAPNPGMPEIPGMPGLPVAGGESDADFPNVSYASNSSTQVMDIFLPENATGSDPVIVVVHGGGFAFGSQTMEIIRPVIEAGTANGYVVASVDYRKSSEAVFPGALADVKAAVRYLRANAGEYGIDPEQVVIWGESAGAYLSLMTALTPEAAELNGDVTDNLEQSSAVAALVDFYGPVEFYTMDDEYRSMGREDSTFATDASFESKFLGQAIGQDKEKTYTAWWGTYVDQLPDGFALRAWVQAGDADNSVPYTQSKNFAAKLAEVIGEDSVTFGLIEGAGHEDPLFYTEENLSRIFDFLAEALR